jgi:hypothetical protein
LARTESDIILTINNWSSFQPRKELKELTWFRINSDIFDGETYFNLKNDGLIFLIFLISRASKKNNPEIKINLDFVSEKLKYKKAEILSFIDILVENQIVHKSAQVCTDLCPTDIQTDNTNKQDNTDITPQAVVDLWNSFEILPKVQKLSESRKKHLRARLQETSFDFKKAIPMILESDFLLGKATDWKITFDWFIENDSNYIKVLEGNYKNKNQKTGDGSLQKLEDQAARLRGLV